MLLVHAWTHAWAQPPAPSSLLLDLFSTQEWDACRLEYQRLILSAQTPSPAEQLAHALATIRSGSPSHTGLSLLEPLIHQTHDIDVASAAAYESARLLWAEGHADRALERCESLFLSTRDPSLFLHAACTAFLIMDATPSLKAGRESLQQQIRATRDLWSASLLAACRLPSRNDDTPHTRSAGLASWIVTAYRTQISPAIGDRCVLHPNCSEYFKQASRKHGLVGFAMIADRFFREPTVAQSPSRATMVNGHLRYHDPVSQHDFWMQP